MQYACLSKQKRNSTHVTFQLAQYEVKGLHIITSHNKYQSTTSMQITPYYPSTRVQVNAQITHFTAQTWILLNALVMSS